MQIAYGKLHKQLEVHVPDRKYEGGGRLVGDGVSRFLAMDETTMPGDLLLRKSSLSIHSRMAALIRQRGIDVETLFRSFLQRSPFSKFNQRGLAAIDVPTFRRCLCYTFGEQWTALAMTSPELAEVYSPYILTAENMDGSVLINWVSFAADVTRAAGVRFANQGYLLEEEDFATRSSLALNRSLDRDDLAKVTCSSHT